MKLETRPGTPLPLGATLTDNGTNFALFSEHAEAVELCLFDEHGGETRIAVPHHTEGIWHIWLNGIRAGTRYGYRVHGAGAMFNPQKLMLDPYAKTVEGKPDCRSEDQTAWFSIYDSRNNAHLAPKAVVTDETFDWGDDQLLQTAWADTIIYEMHVKGFSRLHPDLPENLRGSYAALAHPTVIAYLKNLGITAVELLPVCYHLDEPALQARGLHNYWGYNPLAMFAVEPAYASNQLGLTPLAEFKQAVKALHAAGIEVILDMVFNHTAELERHLPTYSQRGIDDATYYWQENGTYLNWTGCGNMLNLASAAGRRWVVDCLAYWASSCHIDGFRFDLGTVLGRETPEFNPQAQLFADIAAEPALQHCKFIAEPWDIGPGGYQVGRFPPAFAEWNDHFRDDMCRFWLWKSGEIGAFAERLAGSSDFYQHEGKRPHNSINFITAHDGFTLHDLAAYNQKHNEANGEHNRDGRNENHSYNHGTEGMANLSPEIQAARFASLLALLASLLLSNGTPMLLAGDEFSNSQYGNNNAYCQDNETAWLKWAQADTALLQATCRLIALRRQIASLTNDQWWHADNVQWLSADGIALNEAGWHNRQSRAMQVLLDGRWLLLVNDKAEAQTFQLPEGQWQTRFGADDALLSDRHLTVNGVDFHLLEHIKHKEN
ncbi:MAG: glycogen debranching protein GlgX [Neisseria sp.]|uniref:glycogen debranching protein GlgX n=1 Tax=Neisseria sp. TaxID=192066 RepID=UPI0026DB1E41|nr:glycogen debranching protein GlgX [Neisseria sp.]MDO4640839.1 glycogen debranching protein GlgX [Neisseria sp.]